VRVQGVVGVRLYVCVSVCVCMCESLSVYKWCVNIIRVCVSHVRTRAFLCV